jgi:hypothetical protein
MDQHRTAEQGQRAAQILDEFAQRVGIHATPPDDTRELDAAAVQVLDAFAAAGIDALLLKGPALARWLYRAGEERPYSDVDLLVAPSQVSLAREALAGLGYRRASKASGIDDIAGVVHEETWLGLGPSAKHELLIELHLRLAGAKAPPQRVWDALMARRTYIGLRGRRVPVLDRRGSAMQLAAHAAQHGPRYAKGLRELALGLERWPREVWTAAAELAAEIEATGFFAAGLRLVPEGDRLAGEFGLPLCDQLEWEIRHAEARPRGTFHLEALIEARGLAARAGVARRALLPARSWIVWQYPWAARGGPRLMAAYCMHATRATVWAARAWHFWRQAQRAGRH